MHICLPAIRNSVLNPAPEFRVRQRKTATIDLCGRSEEYGVGSTECADR